MCTYFALQVNALKRYELSLDDKQRFLIVTTEQINFNLHFEIKIVCYLIVELGDSGATGQLSFYPDGRRRSYVVDILALSQNHMIKVSTLQCE